MLDMSISQNPSKKTIGLWLAAILLIGLSLRVAAIGQESLWTDEALTYAIAKFPAWALATKPIDPTGPLYYWLHALFIAEGASPAAGRAISLIAGMITIPMTYYAGRRIDGSWSGLVAAAIVATSGLLIDYSQEARAYSLLTMLVLASAIMMLRLIQQKTILHYLDIMIFTGFCILALYTHFVAVFWVGTALIVLRIAAESSQTTFRARHIYGAAAIIAIAAIPEMMRAYRYATEANAFVWLEQANAYEAAVTVAQAWLPFTGSNPIAGVITALAFAGTVLLGAKNLKSWVNQHRLESAVIAGLALQPLLSWLFGFVVSPVFMPRTILLSVPGFAILAAVLIRRFERWQPTAAAIIVTAIASTITAGTVRAKEDWKGAAAFLRTHKAPIHILCPNWKAPAMMAELDADDTTLLIVNKNAMVVARPGSAIEGWDRTYYERFYRPLMSKRIGNTPPDASIETIDIGEVAIIRSQCTPDQQMAINAWMGPAVQTATWRSNSRDKLLAIDVEIKRATTKRQGKAIAYD